MKQTDFSLYTHSFIDVFLSTSTNDLDRSILDLQMSANGQEAGKLNKKERRRNARSALHQPSHAGKENVEGGDSPGNPISPTTAAEPKVNKPVAPIVEDLQ